MIPKQFITFYDLTGVIFSVDKEVLIDCAFCKSYWKST